MADRNTIGQRVRRMRLGRRLSQEALAELAGVRASTIARIEGGHRTPRPATIRQLAKALNVSQWSLMLGDADEPEM